MKEAYRDFLATAGAGEVSHLALFDGLGAEVGDARKAVTWTATVDGLIRPTADLVFDMSEGDDVAEWRGFDALTDGTDYGGAALTPVNFNSDGTYTLQAANTSIQHNAPS